MLIPLLGGIFVLLLIIAIQLDRANKRAEEAEYQREHPDPGYVEWPDLPQKPRQFTSEEVADRKRWAEQLLEAQELRREMNKSNASKR